MLYKRIKNNRRIMLWILPMVLLVMLAAVSACAPSAQPAPSQGGSQTGTSGAGNTGDTGDGDGSTATVTWSPTVDCATCHQSETKSEKDSAYLCGFMISGGAKLACMDCHSDTAGLEKAHKDRTSVPATSAGLKMTQITEAQCTSCHKKDEVKTATAKSTVLTDLNGKVVNPHDIPLEGNYDHQAINCADCHKMHDRVDARNTRALGLCTSCHHESVFECGTCHAME